MLAQNYRDVLVETATEVLLAPIPAQNFFNRVRPGIWAQIVPMNVSLRDSVAVIVDAASAQGWVRDLADRLVTAYPSRDEFAAVLKHIDDFGPPKIDSTQVPSVNTTWPRAKRLAKSDEADLKQRFRNPLFIGREKVFTELETALAARGRVALSGLDGVGKTQTAVEYAHRYLDKYDHAFWANAASREALLDSYVHIAGLLGLQEAGVQEAGAQEPGAIEMRAVKAMRAVKEKLGSSAAWFLLLDNADDLAMAKEFIPPRNGHVVLTTRARAVGPWLWRVEIEPMGIDEGALFLLRRANYLPENKALDAATKADQEAARKIATQLGGLPLALDQAGAYIDAKESGLAGYLNRYQTQASELLRRRGELASNDPLDHPDAVATTWALSFKEIEKANPAAAEILRCCAFLEPSDGIPEEVFKEGAQKLGPVLESVALDPVAWDDALSEIVKFSFLRRDSSTSTSSLQIHRLVQVVLKDQMDEFTRDLWAVRVVNALGYKVHPDSISPDGKYGIIYCTNPTIVRYEISRMRNYLVSLLPYQILGPLEGEIHYLGRNHSDLFVIWADGDEAALVWSDLKWGPSSMVLIEIKSGKLVRQTNLLEKAVALLTPNFQNCKAKPFNEYFPFWIVPHGGEEWTFDGAVHVCIDCTGETNPKHIPRKRSWAARLQAVWNIKEASFDQTNVSRVLCGYYSEDQ
jgi:hypothetical protein